MRKCYPRQVTLVEFKGAYGSPRVIRKLRLRGYPAKIKEQVARLIQENGIKAKHKRLFMVTTDSKHNPSVAQHPLDRKFRPGAPNQVWHPTLRLR